MATIKIDSFSGIMPRVHPTLLPDSCAVKAHNCRLKSGKLSPVREPSKVDNASIRLENGLDKIANAQSIYLWRHGENRTGEFLAWPGIVRVARGNIADDDRDRIFVSGETGVGGEGKNHPCVYVSRADGYFLRHTLYKETLPKPEIKVAPPNADKANTRYTFFFQTWVDQFGYESGASPASHEGDENTDGSTEYNDGDEITFDAVDKPAGSDARYRRIYKVVTGLETESIQFIKEQEIAGEGFGECTIKLKDEDAGEVMPMLQSPPEDLSWITYVEGSYYAGFSPSRRRTVMFSDVNKPTSWPDAYMVDVRDDIVGLAVTGNTVWVMTKGYPWALTGTSPEAMTPSVLSSPQACVSPRSICTMEGAAFYASKDGICMLTPGSLNAPVITEKFFGKREWEALNPSSCIMDTYDGAIHAWFTLESGVRQGYIFALGDGLSAVTTHNEQARAVWYDIEGDSLYFVRRV